MQIKRNEYPRPQFRRDEWLTLNGEWEFEFDDEQTGEKRGLHSGKVTLERKINVPFSYQYPESGIDDTKDHNILWYRKSFDYHQKNKNVILNFNASDYETNVWINGHHAVNHVGGFSPFSVDITKYLVLGENIIVVKCYDPCDPTIPRGKQSWLGERFGCWYIANSGIWQSVWLDFVGEDSLSTCTIIPNIDDCSFFGEIKTLNNLANELEIKVYFKDKLVKKQLLSLDGKYTRYSVRMMEIDFVGEVTYWRPEHPNLFYVDFTLLKDGKALDLVHTRFGMRKIDVDNYGRICLNNEPLYQRLILDQGYWPETGLTPPSIDAIKQDIILAKKMGFNGARKHQKFEDPYFYWYADELGFLTWCEMPSAYNFNADEIYYQSKEWQEIIAAARNFASVICYVPLNESWGVRKLLLDANQQNYARSLYYLTKAIDNTRLVSTNDGWENISETDILSIHDYAFDKSKFSSKYFADNYNAVYPGGRKLVARGNQYNNQPVLFTEFGGIAMQSDATNGNWGYNQGAKDMEEFYDRLENLLEGIYERDFQGYCYTQLTDVQQEVNGLLDANHQPKIDLERVAKIFNK